MRVHLSRKMRPHIFINGVLSLPRESDLVQQGASE